MMCHRSMRGDDITVFANICDVIILLYLFDNISLRGHTRKQLHPLVNQMTIDFTTILDQKKLRFESHLTQMKIHFLVRVVVRIKFYNSNFVD